MGLGLGLGLGLGTKQFSGADHLGEQTLFQTGAATAEVAKAPPAATRGEALKCPRCASTNTKFCYYNNYNKSQPRHFCKSCKRHWTRGGTLRNVPVGGKNKRPKINGDQKTILHQDMFRSYSPTTENNKTNPGPGLNGSDPNLSTAIDVVPTYNNNNQSLISYDQYATSLEESSITSCSVNNIWPGPEWNWNWNWNEIDAFTSSDHLINIAWDWDKYNDDNNQQLMIDLDQYRFDLMN